MTKEIEPYYFQDGTAEKELYQRYVVDCEDYDIKPKSISEWLKDFYEFRNYELEKDIYK